MFTGIIEGFGKIVSIAPRGEGKRIRIEADFPLGDTKLGDSIAVNGTCLTVVELSGQRFFEADVAPETVDRTILKTISINDRVNLERAMKLSDRLHGHIVSGHIDGVGTISRRIPQSNAIIISIRVPYGLNRYMIEKGSVAVDGTSLTINRLSGDEFYVSIIPHTAKLSTVGMKKIGDMVNIETDMIGKYVERMTQTGMAPGGNQRSKQILNVNFLKEKGFL